MKNRKNNKEWEWKEKPTNSTIYKKGNFIVVIGDVCEGFQFYGPFSSVIQGHKFGSKAVKENGEWQVILLRKKVRRK